MHTTVEEGRDQQQHLHPTNRHDVESIVGQSPWAPHWCSRENFILYEPADSVLFPHQNRENTRKNTPNTAPYSNPTLVLCSLFLFLFLFRVRREENLGGRWWHERGRSTCCKCCHQHETSGRMGGAWSSYPAEGWRQTWRTKWMTDRTCIALFRPLLQWELFKTVSESLEVCETIIFRVR